MACSMAALIYISSKKVKGSENEEFTFRPFSLILSAFILHRAFLLYNKLTYVIVSIMTAYRNKK